MVTFYGPAHLRIKSNSVSLTKGRVTYYNCMKNAYFVQKHCSFFSFFMSTFNRHVTGQHSSQLLCPFDASDHISTQVSVTLLTLAPEFSFFLLELSAQSLISIRVWIMNDHRALYKGLCYPCTVLLNRKLFCMPSWSKPVADCLKSRHYLGYHILYVYIFWNISWNSIDVRSCEEGRWHPYHMAHLLLRCYEAWLNMESMQTRNTQY